MLSSVLAEVTGPSAVCVSLTAALRVSTDPGLWGKAEGSKEGRTHSYGEVSGKWGSAWRWKGKGAATELGKHPL